MQNNQSGRVFWLGLSGVLLLGIALRVYFAPDMNYETDSFSVLLAAESITETGDYTIPPVSLTDYSGNYQSHPGWAVGYPLLLSFFFKMFGYSETAARWITILLCAAVIPVVGLVGHRLQGKRAGIMAALLVAVSPLLLCLNGRILTANMGYCLLTVSISFLILATVRRGDEVRFVGSEEVIRSGTRFLCFMLACFFFGLTVMTRDDFAMFATVFFAVSWGMLRNPDEKITENRPWNYLRLTVAGAVCSLAGYLPNLYFNYKTYGKILTSSHYEYGGRLSLEYFLKGSGGALGLPGWAVIIATICIFVFPLFSIFFVGRRSKAAALVGSMLVAMIVPLLLINGSYPVASSGASARYVIPLIPFASIAAAILLVRKDIVPAFFYYGFVASLVLWHAVLIYPPTILFECSPKAAYLTQCSPWYNRHNYINYPHPVRASLQWVREHTPSDAVILSDYDFYHYFFYAHRDVMNRDRVEQVQKQLKKRPVFFIEDHPLASHPDSLNEWKEKLATHSILLRERNSIPLFSPTRGEVRLRMYELVESLGQA